MSGIPECSLNTVWHTATQYFRKGLNQHFKTTQVHLNAKVLRGLHKFEFVYTTYRDPKRVAASWANRGHFTNKANIHHVYGNWENQWKCYEKLREFNPIVLDITKGRGQASIIFPEQPVNTSRDQTGINKALDRGDDQKLYNMIPKDLLDLAIECSQWATPVNWDRVRELSKEMRIKP